MSYLISQMWLCLLAAFLLGAFLYWLLFGRGLKARIAELEADWTTRYKLLENRYQERDTQAKQIATDLDTKAQSLTKAEADFGKTRTELEASMATFASLQSEHDGLKKTSAAWRSELDALKGKLANAEQDLDGERRQVAELKDTRNDLQARIDEHAQNIVGLNKAADAQRGEISSLQTREQELESIVAQLRRDLDKASNESENQLQLITSLKDEQLSNSQRLEQASATLATLTSEKQSLFGDLESDRAMLGSLRSDFDGAQATIEELKAALRESERELADRESASRALQDKARNAEEQLAKQTREQQSLAGEFEKSQAALAEHQREASARLQTVQSKVDELQQQLTAQNRELTALRKAAEDRAAAAQREHDALAAMEGQLRDCRAAREALEAKLAKATAKPDMPSYGLSAPLGRADDLKRVKGIGPKLEGILHGLGIFHFRQIARFSAADVKWVTSHMAEFKGRIERDDWIRQASALHQNDYNEKP